MLTNSLCVNEKVGGLLACFFPPSMCNHKLSLCASRNDGFGLLKKSQKVLCQFPLQKRVDAITLKSGNVNVSYNGSICNFSAF